MTTCCFETWDALRLGVVHNHVEENCTDQVVSVRIMYVALRAKCFDGV